MSNPFKAAQRITCVNKEDCSQLKNGNAYTVKYTDGHLVYLKEVTGGYFCYRFTDAASVKVSPNRDKSGRFISAVSTDSKPISTNNIIPFPTMAKSTNIPEVLKNGAIYKIVGRGFAHLKKVAYDNYVIMTAFGKPTIVDKSLLRIAEMEDVNQFIADERAAKHPA